MKKIKVNMLRGCANSHVAGLYYYDQSQRSSLAFLDVSKLSVWKESASSIVDISVPPASKSAYALGADKALSKLYVYRDGKVRVHNLDFGGIELSAGKWFLTVLFEPYPNVYRVALYERQSLKQVATESVRFGGKLWYPKYGVCTATDFGAVWYTDAEEIHFVALGKSGKVEKFKITERRQSNDKMYSVTCASWYMFAATGTDTLYVIRPFPRPQMVPYRLKDFSVVDVVQGWGNRLVISGYDKDGNPLSLVARVSENKVQKIGDLKARHISLGDRMWYVRTTDGVYAIDFNEGSPPQKIACSGATVACGDMLYCVPTRTAYLP